MKATFEHSVDVLVKAYLNNTLRHGYCMACAVGNLVCDSDPLIIEQNQMKWNYVFSTSRDIESGVLDQLVRPENLLSAQDQIDATGYTWQQLANIEKAFEMADEGLNTDDYMFNGLIAVVDVLAEIHQVDLSIKEQAIGRFEEIHTTKI